MDDRNGIRSRILKAVFNVCLSGEPITEKDKVVVYQMFMELIDAVYMLKRLEPLVISWDDQKLGKEVEQFLKEWSHSPGEDYANAFQKQEGG